MTKDEHWVIIGSEKCPWCDKVKRLLEEYGLIYTWFNITHDLTLYAFIEHSGLTTVPQVYHNGNRVGGFEDTQSYLTEKYADVA